MDPNEFENAVLRSDDDSFQGLNWLKTSNRNQYKQDDIYYQTLD